jgi:hypothetical protein
MCLSKINSTYDKPSNVIVDGWKEFSGAGKSLTFVNMTGDVALDRWLFANLIRPPIKIKAGDGKEYQAGFHVYADETETKKFLHYRRVYLRRITCAGNQDGKACVIAQEMYVPSDPDAWPPMDRTKKPGGKQ